MSTRIAGILWLQKLPGIHKPTARFGLASGGDPLRARTAPDADEAAVAAGGCESHVDQWGGTVLFARSGGEWQMKWYQASLITSDCLKVRRRDESDLLACQNWDNHQGVPNHVLSVVDFSRSERFRQDGILTLAENPETCGEELGDAKTINPCRSRASAESGS
jgi:hypothetical protein